MMSRLESIAAATMLLTTAACDNRSPDWEEPLSVVGPVVAANELVWVNQDVPVATVLDPTGSHAPLTVNVLPYPRAVSATPTGVLLTGGSGESPEVDLISLPGGSLRVLKVAGAYNHADISPNGQYAVLYYDPTAAGPPGGPAARNNNEISIVDLNALSVSTVSLGTESLAPDSTVFSPDQQVVAVVMDGTVVLVSLAQPTVQVQIPLNATGGAALHPLKTLFAPDGAYLYVLTDDPDNVLALTVTVGADSLDSAVNFLFLPGATGLTDIAVPQGSLFDRYVGALYSSNTAGTSGTTGALLDATGLTSRTVSQQFTQSYANFTDLGGGFLVLATAESTAVAGWEPIADRYEEGSLQAVATALPLVAKSTVTPPVPATAPPASAFFTHPTTTTDTGSSSAAATVVALTDDGSLLHVYQRPLVLDGPPTAAAVDPASGTILLAITVPTPVTGSAASASAAGNSTPVNTGSIVTVAPDTLAIGGFLLDDTVTSLGVAGSKAFAILPNDLGDITFFPIANPSRSSSVRVLGFLAQDLLDGSRVTP